MIQLLLSDRIYDQKKPPTSHINKKIYVFLFQGIQPPIGGRAVSSSEDGPFSEDRDVEEEEIREPPIPLSDRG